MLTDRRTIQQKLDALHELQTEKRKRELAAMHEAYCQTIKERGEIPEIILDGSDKDTQRARLLAELGTLRTTLSAHSLIRLRSLSRRQRNGANRKRATYRHGHSVHRCHHRRQRPGRFPLIRLA